MTLPLATKPTMYFIGVTTAQSSMMQIFPRWCAALGIDAKLVGLDFPIGAPAADYRAAVAHIKNDPLSLGALVTTHKLDLLAASRDLFEALDPLAETLAEVSCIFKSDAGLVGAAVDADTSGIALNQFLPKQHWPRGRAEALILGAGGAAVATAWYLRHPDRGRERPPLLRVTDLDAERLQHFQQVHDLLANGSRFETVQVDTRSTDALLAALPAGSLVINATGMGKDRPGSPITDAARFPKCGLAWEFNYRGERHFLNQARAQEEQRELIIEDGWTYFLHGWMTVMSKVLQRPVGRDPAEFKRLAELA